VSSPPATKKEAYLGLTDVAVLVDDGGMAVWLARGSGAKCVALSARRLSLPWEDGEFSWRWMPHHLSRYTLHTSIDLTRALISRFNSSPFLSESTNLQSPLPSLID
jgi:hypothetical protein